MIILNKKMIYNFFKDIEESLKSINDVLRKDLKKGMKKEKKGCEKRIYLLVYNKRL